MISKEIIDLDYLSLFSNLVKDYNSCSKNLTPFISDFPCKKSIMNSIAKKKFSPDIRSDLVLAIKNQYQQTFFYDKNFNKVNQNILNLSSSNSLTITTGHQLNLLASPLFLIYKIINVINLAKKISKISKKNIVPIFWMASEDHDFEEINSFTLSKNRYKWKKETNQSIVGELSTKGLSTLIKKSFNYLDDLPHKDKLQNALLKIYSKNKTLANATRSLLTFFFGKYGLVILDPNVGILKKHFIPSFESEVLNQKSFDLVNKEKIKLSKNYKPILNPRDLNLFYLEGHKRIRIIKEKKQYSLLGTSKVWTKKSLLLEIRNFPDRFSPNVILRTLYQETILPNVVYVAGPSELSYWLQFKSLFDSEKKDFPLLLLRSFVLNFNKHQDRILKKYKVDLINLFHPLDYFLSKSLYKKSKINFQDELFYFKKILDSLDMKTKKINDSLNSHTNAVGKKIEKDLMKLEKKSIRHQKEYYTNFLSHLNKIHGAVYRDSVIQERSFSYIPYYLKYGDEFFDILTKKLNSLESGYIILKGF